MKHFNQLTTGRYIEKASLIHGNLYDYSKTVYTSCNAFIIITCNEHGDFELRASNHTNKKSGCPKCRRTGMTRRPFEEFIKLANTKHINKYDYSQAKNIYTHSKNKIPIICPNHGVFHQTPKGHLKSNGCLECGYNSSTESKRISHEEF